MRLVCCVLAVAVQLAFVLTSVAGSAEAPGAGPSDMESTSFEELGATDVEVLPATQLYDPRHPEAERVKIAEVTLPADARQGGEGAASKWYAVDIHLELDVVKATSEGTVASVYLNGQAFALLTVAPTAKGLSVGGATVFGPVQESVQGGGPQTVELRFRNIVQTVSVQPGLASITADIRNFGAPLVTAMRVLKDSRFVRTRDGPLNLKAKAERTDKTDDDSTELTISVTSEEAAQWRDARWQVVLEGPASTKSAPIEVGDLTFDDKPHRKRIEIPVKAGGKYNATLVVTGSNRIERRLELGPVEVLPRNSAGGSSGNSSMPYLILAVGAIAMIAVGLRVFWRSSARG